MFITKMLYSCILIVCIQLHIHIKLLLLITIVINIYIYYGLAAEVIRCIVFQYTIRKYLFILKTIIM